MSVQSYFSLVIACHADFFALGSLFGRPEAHDDLMPRFKSLKVAITPLRFTQTSSSLH